MSNLTNSTGDASVGGLAATDYVLAAVLFVIVLGVGIAVDRRGFLYLINQRRAFLAVLLGVGCQCVIFPLLGFLLTLIFLAPEKDENETHPFLALGFIAMTSAPGGNISALITLWAKGLLELSALMTICSSVLAFASMTMWTAAYSSWWGLGGGAIDYVGLVIALALVIGPLCLGMFVGYWMEKEHVELAKKILNVIAGLFLLAAVILIAVVEWNGIYAALINFRVIVPSILLWPTAISLVYFLARLAGYLPACARTIAIEAATQNSVVSISVIQWSLRKSYTTPSGATFSAKQQREMASGFVFLYTFFAFALSIGVLVPLSRWQSAKNEAEGINEIDEDLVPPVDDGTQTSAAAVAEDGTETAEMPEKQQHHVESVDEGLQAGDGRIDCGAGGDAENNNNNLVDEGCGTDSSPL